MRETKTVYGIVSEIRSRPIPRPSDTAAKFGERTYAIITHGDNPDVPHSAEFPLAEMVQTVENDEGRYSQTKVTFEIVKFLP